MDKVGISWTQFAPKISTQKLLNKICIQSVDAEAPNKIRTQSIDAEAPTQVAPKTSTQKLQQNLHQTHRVSNKIFTQNMYRILAEKRISMFNGFALFPESPIIWKTVNREIQKLAKMETTIASFP